eukprot:GHVL01040070.1.p1 GENE.GHVL01040070.1~~GHVL01040070.1.p1  ORF type:complete len:571 (+),score=143.38 GHVL01040070.1:79-1791(+)
MGKDSKKNASKKAEKKLKQESKYDKKIEKKENFDEFERIIKEFENKSKNTVEIKVTSVERPGARAHNSFTLISDQEAIIFGGEYYDGDHVKVYNDVFRWNIDKKEWKKVESTYGPCPRCSHQAVLVRNFVYIFGGEFSSDCQFRHFNDLWKFEIKTSRWEQVKSTGCIPTPRSGHRMAVWKNYLILFGGFHESVKENRRYNDLYFLNLQTLIWHKAVYPPRADVPCPRSGHQITVFENNLFIYGGYAKVKDNGKRAEGKNLGDLWRLCLDQTIKICEGTEGRIAEGRIAWEKVSSKGSPPTTRSGASMAVHKNLWVLFGGVHDQDDGALKLSSVFYNDLYAFDLNRYRWYSLNETVMETDDKITDDKITNDKITDDTITDDKITDDRITDDKITDKISKMEPVARMYANVAVKGHNLVIYGGLVEEDKKEITLDDCWTINLNKRDKWTCILKGTHDEREWNGSSDEGGEEEGEEEEGEEEDDSEEDDSDEGDSDEGDSDEGDSDEGDSDIDMKSIKDAVEKIENNSPCKGESLKEYFRRTQDYWCEQVKDTLEEKEIRKRAFELASNAFK